MHTNTRPRDGVEYVISVVREGDRFWGGWACLACGVTGASPVAEPDIDASVRSIEASLGGHHEVHLVGRIAARAGEWPAHLLVETLS